MRLAELCAGYGGLHLALDALYPLAGLSCQSWQRERQTHRVSPSELRWAPSGSPGG